MKKNVLDQAAIYESLKREVEGDLEDLQQTGFDVKLLRKEYQSILSTIEKKLENSKSSFLTGTAVAFDSIGIYINGISELESFQNKLKKYDDYYNCFYSCKTIEAQLEKDDVNLMDALPKMAEEICKSLNVVFYSNTEIYEDEQKIIESTVALAYRMMKLEFVVFGESSIFDQVIQMEDHLGLFESSIRHDLEKVDLGQKKYSKIRNRINRIQQNGIKSHLVDDQLIQLIAAVIDKDCRTALKNNFKNLEEKIDSQHAKLQIEKETLNQLDQVFNSQRKKHVIPKFIGRGLLLAGTALVSSTLLIGKFEPMMLQNIEASQLKQHTVTYYPTVYEEMVDGKVITSFKKDELESELDQAQIIVYSPYEQDGSKYTRHITTYKLPSTSASMSLEKLASLDLNTLEGTGVSETKNSIFPSEMYEQDMIRIIRIFDEKKSYDVVDEEELKKDLEASQSLAKMLLEGAIGALIGAESVYLLLGLKKLSEESQRKKKYSDDMIEVLKRILVLHQENDEIRRSFDKLYPFYERVIPDDRTVTVKTKITGMNEEMQSTLTKLEYRPKKRPQ